VKRPLGLLSCVAFMLLMGAVEQARGDSVTYYTTGFFSGTSSSSAVVSSNVTTVPWDDPTDPYSSGGWSTLAVQNGAGSWGTLTFNFDAITTYDITEPTLADLGFFNLNEADGGTYDFSGFGFEMDIWETLPSTGDASLAATITGQLSEDGTLSTVQVNFDTSVFAIPPAPAVPRVVYALQGLDSDNALYIDAISGGDSTVTLAGITFIDDGGSGGSGDGAVPLPATAGMGLTLLGGLAGLGLLRRQCCR